MQPNDTQITVAIIVLALAFIGVITVLVRRIPNYIDGLFANYKANEDTRRRKAEAASAADLEEKHGDAALASAAADILKVFATTQPVISQTLKRLTDLHEGQSNDIGTLKTSVAKINTTLENGSQPLLSIGKRVEDIYNTVNEIKGAPSLSEDKAQRIEKAIADISAVTPQLTQLVVALQETQAELLQRKYDSGKLKPIAAYIDTKEPLTRDALDVTTDGKPNGKEQ